MNGLVTTQPASVPTTPAADATANMLRVISEMVANPAVDVEKMKAMLDMHDRLLARQAEQSFNAALARATYDMPRVEKNGRVDLGKGGGGYDFARWEDMDAVIRPLMEREGFTLAFDASPKDGGGAVVSGTLLHRDGHSRTVSIPLALDAGAGRNNLQAMGSTLSYGKRYCAEMLLNIVRKGADDDGQAATFVPLKREQVEEIEKLLDDTGSDRKKFLSFMGVREITDLSAARFAEAKNTINATAAARARKAAQGGAA